ncbi:MAG: hypothetical protein IPK28_12250 [Devosia sp.]|nr:hypothetical protein [Devosia sp.]
MSKKVLLALLSLGLPALPALSQEQIKPVYSIWDVTMGQPLSQARDGDVGAIACGTDGGPPGQELRSFNDYMTCAPEASGLREVYFTYDDEQDYITLALEVAYQFLKGGTSVYAQPVIVSLLVDEAGIVQGRRIVTDDRTTDYDRRNAYTLIRNFKARYGQWSLSCNDLPMQDGEQPVGKQFVHELCTGQSPDGQTRIVIEASYLRKKGQRAISQETQQVNKGYFESQTRYEEVLVPYDPKMAS